LRQRYEKRYISGQRLYLESVKPREIAEVVIVGEDYLDP